MIPPILPFNITCVCFFLLGFIALINPIKVNILANRWFGVFLVSVGCLLLNRLIYDSHANQEYVRLVAFNELSRLAIAPALYLSVLHFTLPNKTFRKAEIKHFIPFLLFLIYMLPVVIFRQLYFSIENLPAPLNTILIGIIVLSVKIQIVIYWVASCRRLNQHQKNIQLINSETTLVSLNWLKYLLLGIAFMILLGLCEVFFDLKTIMAYAAYGYLMATLFICNFLLAQKEIYPFKQPELEIIAEVINNSADSKQEKARFTDGQAQQLKNRLELLMKAEKIYLNNDLNLPQLARRIESSPHDLSYLLNEVLGVNFFQYVNGYRIEEAKYLLLSNKHKHLNILGIAYSAGFNSKTTFNTTFKKETGLSPSEFIKQAQNGGSPAISY